MSPCAQLVIEGVCLVTVVSGIGEQLVSLTTPMPQVVAYA